MPRSRPAGDVNLRSIRVLWVARGGLASTPTAEAVHSFASGHDHLNPFQEGVQGPVDQVELAHRSTFMVESKHRKTTVRRVLEKLHDRSGAQPWPNLGIGMKQRIKTLQAGIHL